MEEPVWRVLFMNSILMPSLQPSEAFTILMVQAMDLILWATLPKWLRENYTERPMAVVPNPVGSFLNMIRLIPQRSRSVVTSAGPSVCLRSMDLCCCYPQNKYKPLRSIPFPPRRWLIPDLTLLPLPLPVQDSR